MRITKLTLFAAVATLAASSVHAQPPVDIVSVECNWGKLTMEAIDDEGGKKRGEHASDPTGDGYGRDDVDHERVGLANVVEYGNLQATCEFIDSIVNSE